MRKYIKGLFLIVFALFILFKDKINFPVFFVLFVILFGYLALISIIKKRVVSSFLFLSLIFYIVDKEIFHYLNISFWLYMISVSIICVALNIMFKPNRNYLKYINYNNDRIKMNRKYNDDYLKNISAVFQNKTSYFNIEDVDNTKIETVFGGNVIYLTDENKDINRVSINLDVVFGTVTIYVPKEWRVILKSDNVFSSISNELEHNGQEKIILLTGDIVFSNVKIKYI